MNLFIHLWPYCYIYRIIIQFVCFETVKTEKKKKNGQLYFNLNFIGRFLLLVYFFQFAIYLSIVNNVYNSRCDAKNAKIKSIFFH